MNSETRRILLQNAANAERLSLGGVALNLDELRDLLADSERAEQLKKERDELQALLNKQSSTVTKLCLAIDPECNHGPETDKLVEHAAATRKIATEAKVGVILKCAVCNGLGQTVRHVLQGHIEYEQCKRCDGHGVDTDAVTKLFTLQTEIEQLKFERNRIGMKVRSEFLPKLGGLQKENDALLTHCNALIGIVEGVMGKRWAAGNQRLVDTPEWCAFYVKAKRQRAAMNEQPSIAKEDAR